MNEEIYYSQNPWWEEKDFFTGINRLDYSDTLENFLKRKQIEIITGGRRTGKTTILKQLIRKALDGGLNNTDILYLALDHPRLTGATLSEHLKNYRGLFSHSRRKKLFLFLDEVQESPNWQAELKALYDTEELKIIVSGSTSALLSNQGGKLTGRQIVTQIYPLSFSEFLSFKKSEVSLAETYKYESLAEEYLQIGGYPENVLNPSEEYLINLRTDIISRDIIRLFDIRKATLLDDLFELIVSSVGSRISFTKLSNVLGKRISVDTVIEYTGYFEEAFLIKPLEKWTTSYSEKVYAGKKIYLLDTGLKTAITGAQDLGAKAENAVFIHLLRKKESAGYFADRQKEVDFVLGSPKHPSAIEVKYITEFDWENRRFDGIRLFLKRHPQTKNVLIVTKNVEDRIQDRTTKIKIIPLWKYLLGKY